MFGHCGNVERSSTPIYAASMVQIELPDRRIRVRERHEPRKIDNLCEWFPDTNCFRWNGHLSPKSARAFSKRIFAISLSSKPRRASALTFFSREN